MSWTKKESNRRGLCLFFVATKGGIMDLTLEEKRIITKRRKEKLKKSGQKSIEFSKKIMFFVMSTAFVVILFSIYIINKTQNTMYLDTLITETLNFAKIGVGFYSTKAAAENVFKIKNSTNFHVVDDERGE